MAEYMTRENIEKLIEEMLFQDIDRMSPIMTGKGGIKEFIKSECEMWGKPHTWRNVKAIYTRLKNEGTVVRENGQWYAIFK